MGFFDRRPIDAVTQSPPPDPAERHHSPEPEAGGAQVIAFTNQKGGVAKTTTTLNLAVAFSEKGHRVLCVDLDPQANLTMSQGIDPDSLELSMYDVLVNHISIREVIRQRRVDGACASIDLAGRRIGRSTPRRPSSSSRRTSGTASSPPGSRRPCALRRRRSRGCRSSSTTQMGRRHMPTGNSQRRSSRMANPKRASMREGPLAALFRKTEEEGLQGKPRPKDEEGSERDAQRGEPEPPRQYQQELPPRRTPEEARPERREPRRPVERLRDVFSSDIPENILERTPVRSGDEVRPRYGREEPVAGIPAPQEVHKPA